MSTPTYDEFGRTRPLDVMATCRECARPIKYGQPYEVVNRQAGGPPIGMVHRFCPPRLVHNVTTRDGGR